MQDAAVTEIFPLLGSIDAHPGVETNRRGGSGRRRYGDDFAGTGCEADDVIRFLAGEPQRLRVLARA